ncbi:MAG: class I SAM-dependent methyltransferase [Shimia sp.]|uniref:class I SAM-dependent DNA methyltransferase n=1 Tax=Shimia sp. TaxID=1954381 RepID=UPI0025E60D83|nr:class I SAM-dependent methyltransferase [Shimia sp.]MCH2067343.1 class I SAM-dependent methyltransferase [Shimia sp.]
MSDGVFDAKVAATYDADHGGTDPAHIAQTVDVLADLADGGGALEFAIGTGRIALPLAAKDVPVSGNELSAAMVAEMRKKPGGAYIPVVIGDMCEVRSEGTFSLVFWVFNTIDNLTTQDAQVACFQNAAAHLDPGGRFVIETQLPPLQRLPFGETRLPFAHEPDHWGVDEFDVTTQSYSSHHLWIKDGQAQHLSVPFRYAWPSEMDLMARIAGMTLEHRWADWDRSLFTKDSTKHVSVWRKL